MNIKTKNQLRLQSLINHRIKIKNTDYNPSCFAIKESVLKILDGLIKKRTKILNKTA